jgi:adenine-specific DNA-methyltransferase
MIQPAETHTTTLSPGREPPAHRSLQVSQNFNPKADAVLFRGECSRLMRAIPEASIQLIVTSPPYNIGKSYERKKTLKCYLAEQADVVAQCVRLLKPTGSICWQVGNHVADGEIYPLDILLYPIFASHGLKLRNRIVWHFEHGLHCSHRFSGRYESILWFTKTDDYIFNLDSVRIPQKYPGKRHFKGPKAGQYSCNPLGKNPGDLWVIPNVKHNHVEKTIHPCQFPVELVERLVLALTNEEDWVFDPFMGVGTTPVAAVLHRRRAAGADTVSEYVHIAKQRTELAWSGSLPIRPMGKPVYIPPANASITTPRITRATTELLVNKHGRSGPIRSQELCDSCKNV